MNFISTEYAQYCWELWDKKSHIIRRIETNEISERTRVLRNITYDIDQSVINSLGLLSAKNNVIESKRLETRLTSLNPIPILLVKKGLLFDVDVLDGQGRVLHLCRRHVNMKVTAHIILGLCISHNFDGNQYALYERSLSYLGYEVKLNFESKQRVLSDIESIAREGRINRAGYRLLHTLLVRLMGHYIQCVIDPYEGDEPIRIIKVHLDSSRLEDTSPSTLRKRLDEESPFSELFPQRLGLVSTKVKVLLPIGDARATSPTHMRFVVPEGAVIDDCAVVDESGVFDTDDPNARFVSGENSFLLEFGRNRAVLLDRNLPSGRYRIRLKINPRRRVFVMPAIFSTLMFASLLSMGLFASPTHLSAHAPGYAAALFLAPSAVIAFVIKDNEHDLIHDMLRWSKAILSAASGLTVLTGAAISLVNFEHPHFRRFVFALILISIASALLSLTLNAFQYLRISITRKMVENRVEKYNLIGERGAAVANEVFELLQREYIVYRDRIIGYGVGFSLLASFSLAFLIPFLYRTWWR